MALGTLRFNDTTPRECQKTNKFNEPKQQFARVVHFFVHFFAVFARLRRENAQFCVLWRT